MDTPLLSTIPFILFVKEFVYTGEARIYKFFVFVFIYVTTGTMLNLNVEGNANVTCEQTFQSKWLHC